MTADQKQTLAAFLNAASDYLGDGYSRPREAFPFEDDPETPATAAPAPAAFAAEAAAGGGGPGSGPGPGAGTEAAGIALAAVASEAARCGGCALGRTRTRAVPGEGSERPLVLVVGEGPGAEEDASGRPFVGPAGQLLDRMLASIGLYRDRNCFIANVVKCRPPGNRDPQPEEAAACLPFLYRQIAALSPQAVLAAGRVAAQRLLSSDEPLRRLRGRWFSLACPGAASGAPPGREFPLIVTYHPSALLRDASYKRPAFDDLKALMSRLASQNEAYRREVAPLLVKYGIEAG